MNVIVFLYVEVSVEGEALMFVLVLGAARYGSEGYILHEGLDPHANGRPSPSDAEQKTYNISL